MTDQAGRFIVITGANSGIGLEATRRLAERGADVVMACRNEAKATAAQKQLGSERVSVARLDLADQASIARFADELKSSGRRIDALVNNAGVMALDESRTTDGYEGQFGTNHLGHFALTARLLPLLSDGGRVITVSSIAHRQGRVDLDDPHFERRKYNRWDAYSQSKLANLLFALELDRRLKAAGRTQISVGAHPGVASTALGRDGSSFINSVTRRMGWLTLRSSESGSDPLVRGATDGALQGGEYLGPRFLAFGATVVETPSSRARDSRLANELWSLSERATGLSFGL
jgi:NAD(P)-dependent dehydrogenase (short-subunit alcohol dehydrogenase family)